MPFLNIKIDPIHYSSRCITFTEWISLLTLCFAPLIVHLISGTPTISYLTDRRPRWYGQLCSYNPTSIIWRYAAITDRRVRAVKWSRHDLAATNAIFWTSDGWNGEEIMVTASASYCSRFPESTHVEVASSTMLKTVITTLQGVSALYVLLGITSGSTLPGGAVGFGVDTLFFPLAILGLLRLCAATWLTEDFAYQQESLRLISPTETATRLTTNDNDMELNDSSKALDPLLATRHQTAGFKSPKNSWKSRLFRTLFLLLLGGVWTIALLITFPFWGSIRYSATLFLLALFYFLFISVSLVLYTFYFLRGQTTSTILPCISSTWYRLYTVLLVGLMLALIVVASIETNRLPTGVYTSSKTLEEMACIDPGAGRWWVPMPEPNRWVGFVTDKKPEWNGTTVKGLQEMKSQQEFWMYNFTGWCLGDYRDM